MPQIFHRQFDLFFKLGVLFIIAAVAGSYVLWRLIFIPAVAAPVRQPVPFSHKHHVGDDGIDCRYCHTSVETAPFAGLPPTSTCMTCHSQLFRDAPMLEPVRESMRTGQPLRWNRVYFLPGFAYFDHSIHIAKGVGCESCHGRVDQMPLMWRNEQVDMSFCLSCHRNPDPNLRPLDQVFRMGWRPAGPDQGAALHQAYHLRSGEQLSNCSVCHR